MVVRYILVGDHGLHQREEVAAAIKGRQFCYQVDHAGGRFCHIGSQISAVRAGIGQQLLFVEALCVVKGLLRRVSKQAVYLPLQGGKVIELRRCHHLFFLCHRRNKSLSVQTSFCNIFCFCFTVNPLCDRIHSAAEDMSHKILLFLEIHNLCFTLYKH